MRFGGYRKPWSKKSRRLRLNFSLETLMCRKFDAGRCKVDASFKVDGCCKVDAWPLMAPRGVRLSGERRPPVSPPPSDSMVAGLCPPVRLESANVKRFRGGLVCKAHGRVYHSTLGLRVIKRKKPLVRRESACHASLPSEYGTCTTVKARLWP